MPIRPRSAPQRTPAASSVLQEDLQASVSYFQHLLGGLEQSVERCQAIASRLETQANEGFELAADSQTAPEAPAGSNAVSLRPWHILAPLLCARNSALLGSVTLSFCLAWPVLVLPTVGAVPGSSAEGIEGPSEPSSPDLTDLQAPTPNAEIVSGHSDEIGTVQRPSDQPLARTSAPLRGDIAPGLSAFNAAHVPSIQRRVAACISEVDVVEAVQPFVPHGCPFTIHNPFTGRSQCKIMSEVIQTPQALRAILSDFSARRGPLIPVHPQPDDASVHLIPAAASPSLASVLLRTGSDLHPLCATRAGPAQPFRRIVLNGRHGRVREPYSVSRGAEQPLALHDGDCLYVDTGPFGPPPPTPAGSGTRRTAFNHAFLLAGLSAWLGPRATIVALFCIAGPSAMQTLPPAPAEIPRPRYSIGHYPWRAPLERQNLQHVCRDRICRLSLLCPWRGPQGIYQAGRQTGLEAVWNHYYERGSPCRACACMAVPHS